MKKKVLAAGAALCAIACTGAYAQSSVTLYGVVDSGLLYQGDPISGSGSKISLSGGGQGSSIFGFRGVEDLGGGIKTIFQLEGSFSSANGMSSLGAQFGRVARIGLTTPYGDFFMGRQYTPLYQDALLPGDAFDQFLIGFVGTLFSSFPRGNNSVRYTSPNFYGFTTSLYYAFGGVAGDFSASRSYSGSIVYKRGPLRLNAAYYASNAATASVTSTASIFTGNYDFGPVNVFSEVQIIRSDLNGVPGVTKVDTNVNAYALGARVPLSPTVRLMAQVSYAKDERKGQANAGHALFGAIGMYYFLSKSTNLYFSAGHIFNKGTAQYNIADNTSVAYGQTAFSVGLRHAF